MTVFQQMLRAQMAAIPRGEQLFAYDVTLSPGAWLDATSDGERVWVVNDSPNTGVAYTHSDGTLTRASSYDRSLGTGVWKGACASIPDNYVWFLDDLINVKSLKRYANSNGTLTRSFGDASVPGSRSGAVFVQNAHMWMPFDGECPPLGSHIHLGPLLGHHHLI